MPGKALPGREPLDRDPFARVREENTDLAAIALRPAERSRVSMRTTCVSLLASATP
jgi:hypothetical protein